ncbi:FAD-dependent oxidoreductase [Photobacterium minamisatsumaniensis]|uniref:FAD-dependent oxidoreductase n=1 Tax=Photobacterium minamisatsumaniensis TaxID=2910233 RepID=UPI003D0E4C70
MHSTYINPVYDYVKHADQAGTHTAHHPVIVVGAGPVGLAAALDCAAQNQPVVVLDDNNTVSIGSRAVCYAKRFLEIVDRVAGDAGQRMVDKGVIWNTGKVFLEEEQVYQFNMLPEAHHRRPGFINLQQYYMEEYLVDEAQKQPETIDLRWKNKVISIEDGKDKVLLTIDTPDGEYHLSCDYLIVADGANSSIRTMMGLESKGQIFKDRFLIADVVMKAEFPSERWFWFKPPFHKGHSSLLHKQPDNVWRIDFDLGWDADPNEEKKPENVIPRVAAMLGHENFELEWCSVYTFRCRRMDKFRHGRVLFTGDAAHQVSPFGARGANSGIQDTDNLIWKLKLVLDGKAPTQLLDTYSSERVYAADENIMNSTRSTDFITPKNNISLVFRDAVLDLAEHHEFARPLVNSGRLSVPACLSGSVLNTEDTATFCSEMLPGTVSTDAPVNVKDGSQHWLLNEIGNDFTAIYFADGASDIPTEALQALTKQTIPVKPVVLFSKDSELVELPEGLTAIQDANGVLFERFDAQPSTTYLFRPDQHVTARWREFNADSINQAITKATCNG